MIPPYIRTHSIGTLQRTVVLILLAAVVGLPALAQNGKANSNTASAGLHLRVTVVPTVLTPPPLKPAENATVIYNLQSRSWNARVREESRLLTPNGDAVLKTTTIVAK